MRVYIRGGIGDFLQTVPFAMTHLDREYYIHTHFGKAKEFFNEFGVENVKVYNFETIADHDSQTDEILSCASPEEKNPFEVCPRFFYNNLIFKNENTQIAEHLVNSFKEKRKIIGIHPFGSQFAANVYSSFNLPQKFIPLSIVNEIISEDFNYLIFGSGKELSNYGLKERDNVKFCSFDNIIDSLACVQYCFKFLGTDSCYKTESSMRKIPTFCIVGDFEDYTRDITFINQYVHDGIMKIFKFRDISQQGSEVVAFFKEALSQ